MKLSVHEIGSALEKITGNKKVVVAFSDSSSFENNRTVYREIMESCPQATLLSINYFFSRFLQEKKIEHDCIYNDEMSEEYSELYEKSQQLAQSWFIEKNTQQDFTVHDQLSLGYCLELPMFIFFQAVLKCIVDVEMYLKRANPGLVIYFNTGARCEVPPEGMIDFNIFQNLFSAVCQKYGVEFYDLELSATANKHRQEKSGGLFGVSPPLSIFKIQFRLPLFLYMTLKAFFLTVKNLLANLNMRPGRTNLWFASQTVFNYLGARFAGKIVESKKYNIYIWGGENRDVRVLDIIPQMYATLWAQIFKKRFLRKYFQVRLEEDQKKLRNSTEFKGIPISEICPGFFFQIYCRDFPDLFSNSKMIRKCLRKNKIESIILHSDYSVMERVTVMVGKSLSIPTINIQHGLEGTQLNNTVLGYPGIASHNIVWGNNSREIKRSKGVEGNRITVTGCPLYDFKDYGVEKKNWDVTAPGTFLHICSTGGQYNCDNRMTYQDNEEQLRLLLETMRSFPAKILVIKPRFPDPQIEIYRKIIAEMGGTNIRIVETPIAELLDECDLFFTTFSTSGLEGLILNKPGIQFLFPYNNKAPLIQRTGTRHIPFTGYGAFLGLECLDADTLLKLINSIYRSKETREKLRTGRVRFLEDFANLGGGDPVDNCLAVLEIMTRQNASGVSSEYDPPQSAEISQGHS